MEKYPEGYSSKKETISFQIEFEDQHRQLCELLEHERQANLEYRVCLERLKQEYDRRVAKANLFIKNLSEKIGKFDWFIVPPVMSRTDYGYSSDIDLNIIIEQGDSYPQYNNEIDDIFVSPNFISKEQIIKLGNKYPEVIDWYRKKIDSRKPKGEPNNEPVDVISLEDTLRYSISPEMREQIRLYRLSLAEYFIELAKNRLDIVSWNISGSTIEDTSKFSICSDLDLEIVVDPNTPEQSSEIFFYLHNYLAYRFKEEYQTEMCFVEMDLENIKLIASKNPKMKSFFENKFRIELN